MQEKRQHPRTQVNTHATCEVASGESFDAFVKDMSLGGAYVEASVTLAFGAKLTVTLQLPGIAGPSKLPGVVRWVTDGGFGVQFGLLGARETHAITSLLRTRS